VLRFRIGSFRNRALGALLAVAASVAVAACGGSASGSSAGSSSASGRKGVTIHAAEFTWTAAEVTDDILAAIVKQHPQLGVGQFQTTTLDPAPAWAGAERGDINLLTEVEYPNQIPLYEQAKNKISIVSTTYTGATQGWFVPSYVVAPGGAAAGLKSVTQLNRYRSVFGGKLYDGDPGWVTTKENVMRLKGYHLDYEDVASGETAMLAQLHRAYSLHQPILIYLWHPLWVFAVYKLTQLSEPKPYAPSCFTSGDGACAMPAYSAHIAAAKQLRTQAPRFWAMLERFHIPVPEMEQMLAQVQKGTPAPAVANQWVAAHSSQIDSWISG
jgi:glycine betaine/proline transport system substrate-binding protein